MATKWGLNTFLRTVDPVVEGVVAATWNSVRIQAGPTEARRAFPSAVGGHGRDQADEVASMVIRLEALGVDVAISPIDGREDWNDNHLEEYIVELARRLPGRLFIFGCELNDPKFAPRGGVDEYVSRINAVLPELAIESCVSAGPGQTYPFSDYAREVLDRVEFDVPSLHAYPDRGDKGFLGWLDENERLFRSYGYEGGVLDEVGAHGNPLPFRIGRPSTWFQLLYQALDLWNVDRAQTKRSRRVRSLVESRPFWRSAYVYQIADPAPQHAHRRNPAFGLYRADAITPKPARAVYP